VCVPFKPGAIYQRDAADADLSDVVGKGVLSPDGAQEGVPEGDR
jgi:hypothetical protein